MKGISTIIATILLVVITIGLVSTAYLFVSGILTGMTSKVINLIDVKANRIIIRNDGTDTINANDIKVIVNGQEVEIINPEAIEATSSKVLKFVPPELEMRSAEVNVLGASNTLSYTVDIIPHVPKSTSDTVGLWHFDFVNASDYTLDESLNHNDGLLTNMDPATDLVDGKFGYGLSFDGVNDHVRVPHHSSLAIEDNITIEAWINPTTLGNNRALVSKVNSIDGFELRSTGTKLNFLVRENNTLLNSVTSISTISTGVWTHVAAVFNGTNLILYINGVEDNSKVITTGLNATNIAPLYVFYRSWWATSEYYHGLGDEVRISNRALSQEEILDSIYG